ncbi:heterokaryon incompatibility protein-domain-containing protein [Xylaria digitata]|nr:heterokaryon incompatibility protein-domain-containing protein [Xylaria digitata]
MSTIKCEVLHMSFETTPEKYIAVSYTWGDAEPSIKIHLDGCSFYITPNLYGALKRLRKRRDSVIIWVDALCLMTQIYGQAESVVAWLGPELDNSELAFKLIRELYNCADSKMLEIVADRQWSLYFAALVKLFGRDFWGRLWVVQEILNAKSVFVYCDNSEVPWNILQNISSTFKRHRAVINHRFPRGIARGSRQGWSYAHILGREGPASLNILEPRVNDGPETLLNALRICRRKLAAEPRDKVFGILGILPESVRCHFPPDYNMSLRELYTNIVDMLLHTTRRVDVICDAIYFPIYTNTTKLPTWVPDWSHIPSTAALGGLSYGFSAASEVDADFEFLDPPERTKLKVAAVYIDTVKLRGNPVWTFCTLDDYLMAFLHWHAKLFDSLTTNEGWARRDDAFCRTLALGMTPKSQVQGTWKQICYHVFTSLIVERLPSLGLDRRLKDYTVQIEGILPEERRPILQDNCASKMEGRCFFTTETELMGMGSGFMAVGDIICVPLGCRTPIILRPDGNGEYRLVGDTYLDGYMYGRAVEEWKNGTKKLNTYVLH